MRSPKCELHAERTKHAVIVYYKQPILVPIFHCNQFSLPRFFVAVIYFCGEFSMWLFLRGQISAPTFRSPYFMNAILTLNLAMVHVFRDILTTNIFQKLQLLNETIFTLSQHSLLLLKGLQSQYKQSM